MKKALSVLALFLFGLMPFLAHSQTSANLDLRVTIPRFVELIDHHPKVTSPVVNHEIRVRTSLALTCVHVMHRDPVQTWKVSAPTNIWTMEPTQNGYMFCTSMTGELNLVLTYQLDSEGEPWPFQAYLHST